MKYFKISMIFITFSLLFEVNTLFAQDFVPSQISVGEVEVLVDNIREERIEEQIRDIARAQFACIAQDVENGTPGLTVRITVRQRSYYKSIDNRNSIFVRYTICDQSGMLVYEDCICTEGSGSIVSASMQTKQVGKAARGIKKFLKKQSLENSKTVIAKK